MAYEVTLHNSSSNKNTYYNKPLNEEWYKGN